MGEKIELTVEARTAEGKKVKALRSQGFVPAVMYGASIEPRSIMAPQMSITKVFKQAGKHHPIDLKLGAERQLVMIKSADIDPVRHELRHLAFHVVKQDEKVSTEVPIVIDGGGETPAERFGLVVLKTVETVEIEALPGDLPDSIEAPGEKLAAIGDHLTVGDLKLPKGVTLKSDPNQVIATVYEPSALAAANEAAGGGAEEPAPIDASTEGAKAEA